MALIDLATYKILTNTTGTDNDALITILLDSATTEIQNYCDRIFAQDTYVDWVNVGCNRNYIPNQYPVNKVLLFGAPDTALTITNGGTTVASSYTLYIDDDALLTITDSNLTETTFDLTDALYDTLTELGAAITVALSDLTCVIATDVSQKSSLLKPQSYGSEAGEVVKVIGVNPSTNQAVVEDNVIYFSGVCRYDSLTYADFVVAYKAGYATIPTDLQLICANITEDALNVQLGETNSDVKSESVTNYSYTLADTVNMKAIVVGYTQGLAAYKNIRF